MNILSEIKCNLEDLSIITNNLAQKANVGDVYLLDGDLGVGKTTFARLFINSLFEKYKIIRPASIKSPTFPIMISYLLKDYEIFHYDLYRINNKNELSEIGLFEFIEKNISIIEWPDIILKNFTLKNISATFAVNLLHLFLILIAPNNAYFS